MFKKSPFVFIMILNSFLLFNHSFSYNMYDFNNFTPNPNSHFPDLIDYFQPAFSIDDPWFGLWNVYSRQHFDLMETNYQVPPEYLLLDSIHTQVVDPDGLFFDNYEYYDSNIYNSFYWIDLSFVDNQNIQIANFPWLEWYIVNMSSVSWVATLTPVPPSASDPIIPTTPVTPTTPTTPVTPTWPSGDITWSPTWVPTWWPVGPTWPIVPPPPPPPVITYNTTWNSCTYISSWQPNWSNCSLNSNWDSSWNITCGQSNPWAPVYSTASWSCTSTYVDWVLSWTSCNWSCPSNAVKPPNQYATNTINLDLSGFTSSCDTSYIQANLNDSCSLRFTMNWTTVANKAITWLNWKNIINITNLTQEPSDRVSWVFNATNNNALDFSEVPSTTISSLWFNTFYFDISSIKAYAPLNINNWRISFQIQWLTNYKTFEVDDIWYDFKKPFVWDLSIKNDSLKIWTEQELLLAIDEANVCTWCHPYTISNFSSSLQTTDPIRYIIQNINSETNLIELDPELKFTINYTWTDTIWSTGLKSSPIISYNFSWMPVKYYISETDEANDTDPVDISVWDFVWLKVLWIKQSEGKSILTWQWDNISNVDKFTLKTNIEKNVYDYIKNMSAWAILNWVKYVVWDVTISWDQPYETLVVINWNVTINWNLNPSKNKLWIIVLTDKYDEEVDYAWTWKWNIYITPNVTYINSIIYSDWGFISTDSSWNVFLSDSSDRTTLLSKQLVLEGTLISTNTIGWAIYTWWYYILPSWKQSSDFDLALTYDLNYVRRWNDLWDWADTNLDWNMYNKWNDEPFVIIYNSSLQSDPPKLFEILN